MFKYFFLLLFLIAKISFAQHESNYLTVEQKTYQLYTEEQWDSLIIVAEQSIKQKIDYYYLRYRLGIAYYENSNYNQAIRHLRKALQLNSNDSYLKEYLYFAHLYSKKTLMARRYLGMFSKDDLKSKNYLKKQSNFYIDFESGYTNSNDIEKNGNLNKNWTDNSTFIQDNMTKGYFHNRIGVKFYPFKRFSFYIGYSNIILDHSKRYMYNTDLKVDSIDVKPEIDAYYYSYIKNEHVYNNKLYQNEIYLNLEFLFGDTWIISPSYHYLSVKYKAETSGFQDHNEKAIAYYDKVIDQYFYFDYIKNTCDFELVDVNLNDYLYRIDLQKTFSWFSVDAGASFSEINNQKQQQYDLCFQYFPIGNLNFYGKSVLGYFIEKSDVFPTKNYFIYSQNAGLKISKKIWLETEFFWGNLKNTNWNKGLIIYNTPDDMNYIAGINLILPIFHKITLNLRYQFKERSGSYLYYGAEIANDSRFELRTTTYNNQSIIGGLTWNI